jgi:hypothetical protein
VTGGCRKLDNEGIRDLYSSPSIIRMIKSRRTVGRAYSTNRVKRGTHIYNQWEGQRERDH